MMLGIHRLEYDAEYKGEYAKRCKAAHGDGVVILQRVGHSGVGPCDDFTDNDGHESQAYILHPEDERIGTAEKTFVHNLGHRGPEGCRHKRERYTKHNDGRIGDEFALGRRHNEGKT